MDKTLQQNLAASDTIVSTITTMIIDIQDVSGVALDDTVIRPMVAAAVQKRLSRHFVKK